MLTQDGRRCCSQLYVSKPLALRSRDAAALHERSTGAQHRSRSLPRGSTRSTSGATDQGRRWCRENLQKSEESWRKLTGWRYRLTGAPIWVNGQKECVRFRQKLSDENYIRHLALPVAHLVLLPLTLLILLHFCALGRHKELLLALLLLLLIYGHFWCLRCEVIVLLPNGWRSNIGCRGNFSVNTHTQTHTHAWL